MSSRTAIVLAVALIAWPSASYPEWRPFQEITARGTAFTVSTNARARLVEIRGGSMEALRLGAGDAVALAAAMRAMPATGAANGHVPYSMLVAYRFREWEDVTVWLALDRRGGWASFALNPGYLSRDAPARAQDLNEDNWARLAEAIAQAAASMAP